MAAHPNYPLTVHPSGQWAKKVRGRVLYFGSLADPDEALRVWLEEKDYLLAGRTPPSSVPGITVEQLIERHLEDVDARIAAGKLAARTRRDYLAVRRAFAGASLLHMPVSTLDPQCFAKLVSSLEASGRTLRTQRNVIMATKAVFNWGGPNGMGLFEAAPNYGPRFRSPASEAIEVEQEEAGKLRFFDRGLILAALKKASPKMRVAILLGINCGFYPSDTIGITLDHLHLDCEVPYHDFRRVKTKRRRMAALWHETVEAIMEYVSDYRKPTDGAYRHLLLSRFGRPYAQGGGGVKLLESFDALMDKIGGRQKGVSLGSLRHTYGTVVDLVPDQAMIDLTMGHVNKSIQKRVYSQLNLSELQRLRTVADVVRQWLYGTSVN